MEKLAKVFIVSGFLVLLIAIASRFFIGRPYMLLGVRTLSLIVAANTLFLLAVLIKLFDKR